MEMQKRGLRADCRATTPKLIEPRRKGERGVGQGEKKWIKCFSGTIPHLEKRIKIDEPIGEKIKTEFTCTTVPRLGGRRIGFTRAVARPPNGDCGISATTRQGKEYQRRRGDKSEMCTKRKKRIPHAVLPFPARMAFDRLLGKKTHGR